MILCIADVLTAEELDAVVRPLDPERFQDGRKTAGWHARTVKNNKQLPPDAPGVQEAKALIGEALKRNVLLQMAAQPRHIRPVMFSRYEPGMSYGAHIDDAIMWPNGPTRTDVSMTVFLSDPKSYSGGELVIDTTAGEEAFKLQASSMVIYPASTLHRVEPVTDGVRHAAVSWIQSLVRDPAKREVLFDLDTVRRKVFERDGKSHEFDLVSKSHANLLRMWSDI